MWSGAITPPFADLSLKKNEEEKQDNQSLINIIEQIKIFMWKFNSLLSIQLRLICFNWVYPTFQYANLQ